MKLIIASNNTGKIREYKDIFEPFGFQVVTECCPEGPGGL